MDNGFHINGKGTQQIIVGLTLFIASTKIVGDGIRPNKVT
jgi:hypothetical protein